jgi:2-dehydropantoate 2-reductase
MNSKKNIVIAGIGGVGGFFGGLLANFYEKHEEIQINFFARGENLEQIKKNGLKIQHLEKEFVAKPNISSHNASDFGTADCVVIACKSYDLDSMLEQLKPCIDQQTIIMPLLNGVDSRTKIQVQFKDNLVLKSCVYIVARLHAPGWVKNHGNVQTLFFGIDKLEDERLRNLEHVFKSAGLEATCSTNINSIVWEKFSFISPTATATSFYDNCISEIAKDAEKLNKCKLLIEEITALAKMKSIELPANIVEKTLMKLSAFPDRATTSMHSDFQKKSNKTELDSITGYVLREAKRLGLEVPTYSWMYGSLLERSRTVIKL